MTKRLMAWILLAALAQGLYAAQNVNSAASLAFPSIEDGAGARAIALGSTYVGIDEGSAALLWNPAGLGRLQDAELALHHNAALVGSTQDVAVLGLPLGYGNGLGLSVNYQDDGTFDGRDTAGVQIGDYSVRTYGGSIGWGISGLGGVSLGLAGKFNQSDIAGTGYDAFAGDLGLLWNICPQFTIGAAYNNLGPDVNGSHLAQGLRVGISSYSGKGGDYQCLLALSGESLAYGPNSLHLGLEETLYRLLALRAGYAVDVPMADGTDTSELLGWTFGVGLCLNGLSVDYAYVPMTDLGGMQRVSVTYDFGGTCCAKPSATPTPEAVRTYVPAPVAAAPTRTPWAPARIPVPQPTASPVPAPVVAVAVHTPDPREAAPGRARSGVEGLDDELLLTDADFYHPVKGKERERLTNDAQKRITAALAKVSGKPGAQLTINGETKLMRHPYGSGNAEDLREIGGRRNILARAFVHKKMAKAEMASRVTLGSDKGSPASIFQIILR